jgi:hypothetical protein
MGSENSNDSTGLRAKASDSVSLCDTVIRITVISFYFTENLVSNINPFILFAHNF